MNNKIVKLINVIKVASICKKNDYFCVEYTKKTIQCVEYLYKEGYLLSYNVKKLNNNVEKLFINIKIQVNKCMIVTQNIKCLYNIKNPFYCTYSEICVLPSKKKEYFLYTDKGFLTLNECRKKRVGGILILKI